MTEWLLLVGAAAVALVLGAEVIRGWQRDRTARRHLRRLGAEADAKAKAKVAARARPPGRLQRRLRAAGLRLPPWIFALATATGALLIVIALWLRFPTAPLVALVSGGFALYVPFALVRAYAGFRARRFENKLADAIDFLVGALEGGQNATQALASTAQAAEEPIRSAFADIARRIDLGMSPARAVAPVVQGYDAEGTRIFTQTLITKLEVGGPLGPVLRSVNRLVRARLQLRLRLRSQLSGAQFGAVLIALMPYVLIPVYAWRKPDWIGRLLDHPAGPQALFVAVVLQIIGFLWIRRILRLEVV